MDKPMFLSDSLINDVETTGYVGEQIEDKIDVRERLLYRPDNYLLNQLYQLFNQSSWTL